MILHDIYQPIIKVRVHINKKNKPDQCSCTIHLNKKVIQTSVSFYHIHLNKKVIQIK